MRERSKVSNVNAWHSSLGNEAVGGENSDGSGQKGNSDGNGSISISQFSIEKISSVVSEAGKATAIGSSWPLVE